MSSCLPCGSGSSPYVSNGTEWASPSSLLEARIGSGAARLWFRSRCLRSTPWAPGASLCADARRACWIFGLPSSPGRRRHSRPGRVGPVLTTSPGRQAQPRVRRPVPPRTPGSTRPGPPGPVGEDLPTSPGPPPPRPPPPSRPVPPPTGDSRRADPGPRQTAPGAPNQAPTYGGVRSPTRAGPSLSRAPRAPSLLPRAPPPRPAPPSGPRPDHLRPHRGLNPRVPYVRPQDHFSLPGAERLKRLKLHVGLRGSSEFWVPMFHIHMERVRWR